MADKEFFIYRSVFRIWTNGSEIFLDLDERFLNIFVWKKILFFFFLNSSKIIFVPSKDLKEICYFWSSVLNVDEIN